MGRNLRNLTNAALRERLERLDRNIQYLDDGLTGRDDLPVERGWLSPWWWLRARHWTSLEFAERGISLPETTTLAALPRLRPEFRGVAAGGKRMLVRISQTKWLQDTLGGVLRFVPASRYIEPGHELSRADDEMGKSYRRPGQVLSVTLQDGTRVDPIGDVSFTRRRVSARGLQLESLPYWFCSFSSDLDPRLLVEFPGEDPLRDGFLVIFDPDAFVTRALPALNASVPHATKSLFPTDYFDPWYPPREPLSASKSKDFQFAHQREMRFALDPEGGRPLSDGRDLFVTMDPIDDIAGIYDRDGARIAGSGPPTFFE
ncbi:hypothetical protein [Enterovirga sp. CN4-39]|uniref:hypothetical protein n=1 Tax=Enterovirga sp. CN4-39 TaxID=3400910 RepID=UPI003C0C57D3